jgi:hypothetical protein
MSEEAVVEASATEPRPEEQPIPQMTDAHRLTVVKAQRRALQCQVQLREAQDQLTASIQAFNQTLDKVAKDLNLDMARHAFDIENLEVVKK